MKKVTSVIVALMMLFSILTVAASAAVNDAVLALRVTPTATSYKAGDVVTFEVSYEATENIGKVGICTLHIGYNSSVFELLEDASGSPDLDGSKTVFFDGYALSGTVSLANSFIQPATKLSAADTAKGWDSVLKIAMTQDGALFDASTETKAFAFKLKVKDGATGNHTVGITQASIDDYSTFVNEELGAISGPNGAELEFPTAKVFDLGDASVVIEGGSTGGDSGDSGDSGDTPAAPEAVVNTLPTQVQWKEADPTSGLMNVAFRGQIASGYNAVADKTGEDGPNGAKLASLSKVGVYLSVDGGEKAPYESQVIYNFTDGTYFFRVVVGNWEYNNAKELKAEAFIVIKGADGQDYEFKGSEITTSGTQEYTRATTKAENPMPEYAGA
jgi:hypothetical protein